MLNILLQYTRKMQHAPLGIMLIICISLLCAGLPGKVTYANSFSQPLEVDKAFEGSDFRLTSNSCSVPPAGQPGPNSLLVVLLDRSGSLIDGPRATDPNHYSTSVTKGLADLWPGRMVIIPFKGDTIPLQQIGPYAMSDPTQRDNLKNQIPEADPNGDTPLGQAMDQALQLTKVAAPGSRIVVITDGEPNTTSDPSGSLEEAHIRNSALQQFCQRGIPVSSFGLEIHNPRADALLSDIALGTNGTYTKVQSPEQLAQNVIRLYRDWQNLALSQPPRDVDGSYSVFINDFASHAYIVAFRSGASYQVQLFGSDGKTPASGISPLSIDTHYVLYSMDMTSFATGTYKVKVVNSRGISDSAAQVYALADYPQLQVHLIAPDAQHAYIKQPLLIRAALFKGQKQYLPIGVATLTVDIISHVAGQLDKTMTGKLDQQGQGDFRQQFPAYSETGQLRIVIHATYQGIQKDSQVYTLPLVAPPPSQYVCKNWPMQCFVEQHLSQLPSLRIWLLVLLLLLIGLPIWVIRWRKSPVPYGYLVSCHNERNELALDTHRPLFAHLFSKSVITMQELAQHPQGITVAASLLDEPMAFVASNTGISLRLIRGTSSSVSVMTDKGEEEFSETQRDIQLGSSSELRRNGIPVVIFQQMMPRSLTASLF
jgi:hypothetical protein